MSGDSALRRLNAFPAVVQGAILMTAAAFCFALMNVLVREANAAGLSPIQIAFLRNIFALVSVLPWVLREGKAAVRTERLVLHGWRAVVGICAMFLWFTSVTLVPLAEAVALNFTLPLFAIAGAALILREEVGPRRWGATAMGFFGMLVILRPGFAEVSGATLLPIVAAVFMAGSVLMVKRLSATDRPVTVVFYMNLFMTLLALPPSLYVWQWPSAWTLAMMALLGFLAMIAHIALTLSYARADASAVMPFDYMRLPFTALVAFLLYGEVADIWTWCGAAIIAGSAFYIVRREARLARRRALDPTAVHAVKGH